MSYKPIGSYGIIGDLHTVALVGSDGSIDFMSFPRFDSPTIFAALLDHRKGGRFKIAPTFEHARQKQLYLPDSNMLLSRFLSDEGVAEVSDFMPVGEVGHPHTLIRRAMTVRGEVTFRMECTPRFDYGRARHRVEQKDGEAWLISEGADATALRLRCSVPFRIEDGWVCAQFKLSAGQSADFILEPLQAGEDSPAERPRYVEDSFKTTMNFWRRWMNRSKYQGRWRETVNRSALTLKLLTSQEFGSLVAAPTFGLPERIGGVRNWDYRYTWIRDTSFTLRALMQLGYMEESRAFLKWLEERSGELEADGSLRIMYGIDGRRDLEEQVLPHFEGYRGSRPVRVGNGAAHQLQLDIYGELLDAINLYDSIAEPISYDLWRNLLRMMEWLSIHWCEPDDGIWEFRSGRHEFLYSRALCWVAFDRAMKLANRRSFPAPIAKWRATRDRIHHDIYRQLWNSRENCFVQHKGSTALDAAALILPQIGFISPVDPRWLSTLSAIERHLVEDSLVYRYGRMQDSTSDGLEGDEGTFCMCSFWYIDAVARSGDLRKARFFFEKMLGYANHLGLYAEELGPAAELLGNYPQAFTHVALISSAIELDQRLNSGADFIAEA